MEAVDEENFASTISRGLSLVYCWHEECGPCKNVKPRLLDMEQNYVSIAFLSLNVRDNSHLSSKLECRMVPQLLLFKNGELKGRIMHQQDDKIRKALDSFIDKDGEGVKYNIPDIMRNGSPGL